MHIRRCASPKDIAQVLWEIGRVSRGDLASIKVIGETDTIWLAAFSEWLLALPTSVRDKDHTLVFSNCRPEEQKIHIFYQQSSNDEGQESQDLESIRTYRLDTGLILIQSYEASEILSRPIITGRMAWTHCLSSTFGAPFRKLSISMTALGVLIGSAASLFTAICNGTASIDFTYISERYRYCSNASHGENFISNIVNWFLELFDAKSSMEGAIRTNLIDVKCQYEAKMTLMEEVCACSNCRDHNYENAPEIEESYSPVAYCLPVLVETIIRPGQTLSMLDIAEGLYPTRSGLELTYARQLMSRRLRGGGGRKEERRCFETLGRMSYLVSTEVINTEPILQDALHLFTGRFSQKGPSARGARTGALAKSGICVYFDSLCELNDELELIGRVHVVPGRIEHYNKPYFSIVDQGGTWNYPNPPAPEVWSSYTELSLLVTEQVESLGVAYESKSRRSIPVHIGPAEFTYHALQLQHPHNCTRRACLPVKIVNENILSDSYRQVEPLGMNLGVFRGETLARCTAIVLHKRKTKDKPVCISGNDGCLSCCLRLAAQLNAHSIMIISGSYDRIQEEFTEDVEIPESVSD